MECTVNRNLTCKLTHGRAGLWFQVPKGNSTLPPLSLASFETNIFLLPIFCTPQGFQLSATGTESHRHPCWESILGADLTAQEPQGYSYRY